MNYEKTVVGWMLRVPSVLRACFYRRPRPPIALTIGHSEVVLRLPVGRSPVILVTQGVAWITQAGDPVDYCLTAGQEVRLSQQGSVAVQALGNHPCQVRLWDL